MSRRNWKILLIALITASFLFRNAEAAAPQPVSVAQVQRGIDRLQQWYNPKTGLWNTAGWWSSANALTMLIDYSRVTGSQEYLPVIENTYEVNRGRGFTINRFYDDEGWWALAWIDAYDLTGKQAYLDMAGHIFEHITQGWDNTCGGGLWQTTDRVYKDAIVNELFLSVAAHLANRVNDPAEHAYYAKWAEREWKWFAKSGMIETDNLIVDGLNRDCQDNHGRKFTYNQGVILGGLVEFQRLTGDKIYLAAARLIADSALMKMSDRNGVLHERCEPSCSRDSTQFKGVFVRNLAVLYAHVPSPHYASFLRENAASLLTHEGGDDKACFGVDWSAEPAACNAVAQSAALDELVAALATEVHNDTLKSNPGKS